MDADKRCKGNASTGCNAGSDAMSRVRESDNTAVNILAHPYPAHAGPEKFPGFLQGCSGIAPFKQGKKISI